MNWKKAVIALTPHWNRWMILHPEEAMTGRVLTAQFIPSRPDFNDNIQAQAK